MNKANLLLAIPFMALTSCGSLLKPDYERVERLIFDYTEHMGVTEKGEENNYDGFFRLGNSTIAFAEGADTYIVASRFDEGRDFVSVLMMSGYRFMDGSYVIDELSIAFFEAGGGWGYGVCLESEAPAEELVTVDLVDYMEDLKTLTQDDIRYALNALSERKY